MSEYKSKKFPYKQLGEQLKSMRVKRQQSITEVSGAVEIDDMVLSEIEQGAKRPAEDILMLLISYFSLKDEDAVKLWELAGYTKIDAGSQARTKPDEPVHQILVVPIDARIAYTDMANITTNNYGVTLNFLQSEGINGQPISVARVGMSKEHALRLLKTLERSLIPEAPKMLPAPEVKDNPDTTKQ